jgi:hypothetical protein
MHKIFSLILITSAAISVSLLSMQTLGIAKNVFAVTPAARNTISRRAIHGCPCTSARKPYSDERHFNPHAIDKRIYQFNQLQKIVSDEERLKAEGTWPVHAGESVKQALLPGTYCANFSCCMKKVNDKELRNFCGIWGIASAYTASIAAGAVNPPIMCAAIWSTAYVWLSKIRAEVDKELLTDIAEKDVERLTPVWSRFQSEHAKLLVLQKS